MRNIILLLAILSVTVQCAAPEPTTLKQAYQDYFKIGVAVSPWVISRNQDALELVIREMNSITPENCLKWEKVHPKPNTYKFKNADRFVEMGEAHDMFMVGHTLVWHNQTPNWVFENGKNQPATREQLLNRMQEHINKVAGRYA